MTKKYRQPGRRPPTAEGLQPAAPVPSASVNYAEGFWRSEDRYRSVVTAMTEGMVLQRADGTIFDCNEQAARILGLTQNQILGKSSRDPIWRAVREDGSDFPGEEHPAMIALKSGRPCRHVVMGLHLPAGGRRWINVNAEPLICASDTKPQGVVVTFTDITERKLAEEALRNSEKQYRALFANMQNGFAHCRMIFNQAGRAVDFVYLKVNPAFTRLTGLKHVVGRRVTEVVPGIRKAHPELFEIYGRVTRTGRPEKIEVKFKSLALWLQIAVYRPQPGHFAAVFENVTERKLSEEALRHTQGSLEQRVLERTAELNRINLALRESEASLLFDSQVMAKMADGVQVVRAKDLIIVQANPRFEFIFGWGPGELVGKHVSVLNAPVVQHPEKTAREIKLTLDRQGEWSGEILNRGKNGNLIWCYATATRFDHPQHGAVFISTHHDITERKRLEQEILTISDWERRRIALDLHDGLGQILVGASYLAETLKNDLVKKSSPAARRLHRLREVIQAASNQARILARGVQPVEPEPNGLTAALNKLAMQTHAMFGVRCVFRCRLAVNVGDPQTATHLFRIAQESVTNAIKHGKARRIVIRLTQNRQQITLAVTDNGLGMAAGRKHKTGMGLRIMHYRAGLIGGALAIKNNSAGGAAVICRVGLGTAGKLRKTKGKKN